MGIQWGASMGVFPVSLATLYLLKFGVGVWDDEVLLVLVEAWEVSTFEARPHR
jgi:hypothetical protein